MRCLLGRQYPMYKIHVRYVIWNDRVIYISTAANNCFLAKLHRGERFFLGNP